MEQLLQGVVIGLIGLGIGATLAQMDGPLGLFKGLRWMLTRAWLPLWLRENADCIFCWSFYGCMAGVVLIVGWPVGVEAVTVGLVGYGVVVFLLKYVGH